MSEKNLHEGHRARMRKRFRETGFDGFSEHEILELLLFYTCPRRDTNELAHALIDRFGSLAAVINADYDELTDIKGISENTATLFKIFPALVPKYYESNTEKKVYNSIENLKEMFESYFIGLNHEEFRIACFNSDAQLLSHKLISKGTPSSAPCDIRAIMEEVLKTNASAVAFAHNHPNSCSMESNEDIRTTRDLASALNDIDVELLDHIIVNNSGSISMRQMGYLNLL